MATKFRGADKHLRRLKGVSPRTRKEATKLVYTLADMHVAEASQLITAGAVSGKNHQPSSPHEPPNEDTGALRNSGHVESAGPLKARSVFDAPHAVPLEFGTSKMIERPFSGPAAKTIRKDAKKLADAAKVRIVQGGTL